MFEFFVQIAMFRFPIYLGFAGVLIFYLLSGRPLVTLVLVILAGTLYYFLRQVADINGFTLSDANTEADRRIALKKAENEDRKLMRELCYQLNTLLDELTPGIPPVVDVKKTSYGYRAWGSLDTFDIDVLSVSRLTSGLQTRLNFLAIQAVRVKPIDGHYVVDIKTSNPQGGVRHVAL